MKTLWSKLNGWYDNLQNKPASEPEPEPKKFPALRLIFGPYNLFIDNSRRFFMLGGILALVMTAVFLLLGQNLMCAFDTNSRMDLCADSPVLYFASRLAGLFLVSVFSVRIYESCYAGAAFSWRWLLRPQKADAKMFAAYAVYLGLNLLSLVSAYLLYVRVPNPDWRIEFAYFTVVSLGFLVPFVLLRFYSLFAFVMEDRPFPPLRQLWRDTSGNGLRLLVSFALLFCVLIFSLNSVINNFRLVASENTIYITFVAEYIFNLVVLLNIMFFVNCCRVQKEFLFGEK
ncbi:MAG: hypothetical protein IJ482_03820 [Alphaproteobacteria bacterium]|nr:hypothetical protein [Alphaproteobacteria bacterium]